MTLKKWLIVLGAFVLAFNLTWIGHGYGGALNLAATGGRGCHIMVSPLWGVDSYSDFVTEPRATAWGGVLWGSLIPVGVFLVLWVLKSRLSFWALVFAATSLACEGTLMLVSVLRVFGDARVLIAWGISKTALIVLGSVLVAASVVLASPVGALIGVGRRRSGFGQTALVIGSPILAYLAVIMTHICLAYPKARATYAAYVGIGCGIALAVAALVHLAAPLFSGPECRARAAPVGWPAVIISVVLAAAVIMGEVFALFPFFDRP